MGLLFRREVCINLCGFDESNTEMGIESMHKDEISQRLQHADWEQNRDKQWKRTQSTMRKKRSVSRAKESSAAEIEMGESFQGK